MRNYMRLCGTILLGAGGLACATPAGAEDLATPPHPHRIQHALHPVCLGLSNVPPGQDTPLGKKCSLERTAWRLELLGNGLLQLREGSSGLCLSSTGQESARTVMIPCASNSPSPASQWAVRFPGNGVIRFVNQESGLCLGVQGTMNWGFHTSQVALQECDPPSPRHQANLDWHLGAGWAAATPPAQGTLRTSSLSPRPNR